MILQLANQKGEQVKALLDASLDAELNGGDRTFQISFPLSNYDKRIQVGCRMFIPGTEIGGIVGEQSGSTSTDTIAFTGYVWRGMLGNKVIKPPDGQDHFSVSGELNTILRELIEPRFGGLFRVPESDTGVSVNNYKFDRFCTLLDGLVKMLKSVGYRLEITYNEGMPNGSGWVDVRAVPITDYSKEIELSQDSKINFRFSDKRNGVNHLIIGGKGDLQDRTVIDLYVQGDGIIGTEQYYFGVDEIERFYENTSADTADVESKGKEYLESVMNKKTFDMDVQSLGIDVAIGDIIGGRDYISGTTVKKPLDNIIVTIKDGVIRKDYKLEGTT